MTTADALYHLQQLDSEIDRQTQRLQEIADQLGESKALKSARKTLQTAEEQLKTYRAREQDLTLEIEGLEEKASHDEKKLYSGSLTNPKELADLQAEVASVKKHRSALEDTLLDVMIDLEQATQNYQQAQATVEQIQTAWSTQQTDLRQEQTDLQAHVKRLEKERATLLPAIDDSHLTTYQNLRACKNGLAVSRLEGDICTGCSVTVTNSIKWQLREEEIVQCNNCQRFLVKRD